MTYGPYHRSDPYSPHPGQPPYSAQQPPYPGQPPQGQGYGYPPERRRGDGASTVASIVWVVVGLVVTIFALHVLFVVLDANQGNGFVSTVYTLAKTFVLGMGDVFTPEDAVLGVVMNYGLAALVYLVIGHLVIKALRRP